MSIPYANNPNIIARTCAGETGFNKPGREEKEWQPGEQKNI